MGSYYERVSVFVPSVSLGAIAFICKRVSVRENVCNCLVRSGCWMMG